MIANIPLATESKLNCFISASKMLSIILDCAPVLSFLLILNVNKSSSPKIYHLDTAD